MNKIKRYFKNKRIVTTLGVAATIIVIYLLLIMTINLFDYVDKHHCLNMPFDELIKDVSCDKYWRDNGD